MKVYDLLILGSGPAGMAAAIYGGRYGLSTLVVGSEVGGMVNLSGEIENYPGFVGSGIELMRKFEEQARRFGSEFVVGKIEKIKNLASRKSSLRGKAHSLNGEIHVSHGDLFEVTVDDKVFRGRSVISALGSKHRKLGIPGEEEFLGKGVSYCATCDGNFFRGKVVAVVGGSDAAAKATIYLAGICEKVYIVYRGERMRCEPIYLKRIESLDNVEIIYNSTPTEIFGGAVVEGVRILIKNSEGLTTLSSDGSTALQLDGSQSEIVDGSSSTENGGSVLDVDGVFVEIGSEPVTDVFEGLGVELDRGYVKVDREGRTSVEGLFAAGDGTNNPFKQAITAAADGAIASKSAFDWLSSQI